VIRSLDDVTLVPTPVRKSIWASGARVEVIEEKMQAELFTELNTMTNGRNSQ
jgi:hypothetical protein